MAERRRRRRLSEDESGEEVSEDIKDTETRERLSECVCRIIVSIYLFHALCVVGVLKCKISRLLLFLM